MVVSVEDLSDKCNNGIPYQHNTRAVAIWLFPRTLFGRISLDLSIATRLWLSWYTTWQTQHPSCRDLTHFSWTPLFDVSSLDLSSNELLQLPATVFASMTSLRSHLCGSMQWNVCMLGDRNKNQTQIRSPSSSKHKSRAGSGTLRGGVCCLAYVCRWFSPPFVCQIHLYLVNMLEVSRLLYLMFVYIHNGVWLPTILSPAWNKTGF